MHDTRNAAYAALLLRLSLGALFLSHGLMKLFVFTPAGTVQYFESIGFRASSPTSSSWARSVAAPHWSWAFGPASSPSRCCPS